VYQQQPCGGNGEQSISSCIISVWRKYVAAKIIIEAANNRWRRNGNIMCVKKINKQW